MSFRSSDILDCFPKSYLQARHAFVRCAAERGATVTPLHNAIGKGASDESLFMDVATLGRASGTNVIVVSCGTHGIEGFAGSAILVGLLKAGIAELLPRDTVCHLVHAVNPFGFSWHRRVNEDNVDLNRNFIDSFRPLPSSDEFCKFRDFASREIAERRATDDVEAAERYLREVGEHAYQRSLTMGQYVDKAAIYYGGREPAWSNRAWRRFLSDALPGKSLAIHMDIHTGLGPYGTETLIYTRSPQDPGFDLAGSCFGTDELLVPGENLTPEVSGPIPSSFGVYEKDMPVIGVAPEFGTVPLNEMLDVLIEENALWLSGCRSGPDRRATIGRMMECFCPDDRTWRLGVWRQFARRVGQAVEFLKHW